MRLLNGGPVMDYNPQDNVHLVDVVPDSWGATSIVVTEDGG